MGAIRRRLLGTIQPTINVAMRSFSSSVGRLADFKRDRDEKKTNKAIERIRNINKRSS